LRRIQLEPGPQRTAFELFCPRTVRAVDLERCGACEFGRGLCFDTPDGEMYLRCGFERGSSPSPEGQAAPYAPVSSITRTPPLRVNRESTLASVTALFAQHADEAALAVDADGHAVGIVTKSAAWRELYGVQDAVSEGLLSDFEEVPRVKHIMAPLDFTLHPEDDVSDAAALMAHERITHVAVSLGEKRVFGILSAFDVLRWLAGTR